MNNKLNAINARAMIYDSIAWEVAELFMSFVIIKRGRNSGSEFT